MSTASGRRQTARGASNGTVLQERIRKSGGALDGTRPTRFSPVCPPRRKIVIGANSLRQDFALNLLAKRRLCNTVGGGIGRSVEDCVVSDARSRAAATTNLARSSQALVLSTLFMICPQWSAWWPADEQIVPPIPRLSYGVARPLAPTFPVEMSPLSARPHRSCGATVRQSKPNPTKLHRALGWQIRCATPSASAHPSTRRRWTVTGPGSRLFSAGFSAGLWRRHSTTAPLDSQPAVTILQTESSRRSTTSDEKCHPRPHHRSAA